MLTFRALGALLAYPGRELIEALPEISGVLESSRLIGAAQKQRLSDLVSELRRADPFELEERYVALFDCGRATSLHLFEHVHGDSRDRGPAMIDLAQTYAAAGLLLKEGELPDYLPAVLEFASTQPPREAKAFLGEIAHLVNAIFGALLARGSPYAAVMGALLDLAGEKARAVPPPAEPALDESWAEPPAFDGCSVAGQASQPIRVVRRMVGKDKIHGAR
jgi:nitrate reductase delta subunit